jgi:CarD family transcriptional regulator
MTPAMVTAALEATAATLKPKDSDPFVKGDAVVYLAHGVGWVDKVGYETIAGHRLHLIHISFAENQMTLRVPVARARMAGLRKLASPQALDAALDTLKGRPRTSRLMWAKRSQECLAKINTGDVGALAEVVRDLQPPADGSAGSTSRRHLFELARDRLAAELAAIRQMAKPEAIELLHRTMGDVRTRADTSERPPALTGA